MKALQITGPDSYQIVDAEIPTVQDNEVLVEIEIVATCPRWDLHMMAGMDMFMPGKSPDYPLPIGAPGHEAAGTVRAIGKDVKTLKVGDRVTALEHLPGNGAYAQYLCYPEDQVLKLPDEVSFKQATSFELLKCVVIGLRQFDDLRGRSMVVAGLGPAGLLAVQLAKIWGCSRVVGIDVSEKRLAYAKKLGIAEIIHADQLGDERFDLGYDCVGYAKSVQNVLDHVNKHVVVFGVLKGEVQFGGHLWGRGVRLETYGGRRFTARDMELLLDAVVDKGLNTEVIQTHNIPFTKYHEAVELLKAQDAIKVHFYPQKDFIQGGSD